MSIGHTHTPLHADTQNPSVTLTHSNAPEPPPKVTDWESARALHDEMARLPGRCQECAQHVGTQGHHDRCQQSAPITPEVDK